MRKPHQIHKERGQHAALRPAVEVCVHAPGENQRLRKRHAASVRAKSRRGGTTAHRTSARRRVACKRLAFGGRLLSLKVRAARKLSTLGARDAARPLLRHELSFSRARARAVVPASFRLFHPYSVSGLGALSNWIGRDVALSAAACPARRRRSFR